MFFHTLFYHFLQSLLFRRTDNIVVKSSIEVFLMHFDMRDEFFYAREHSIQLMDAFKTHLDSLCTC